MPLFHFSINPAGVLFLGNAETTGSFGYLFTLLNAKSRIYWRGPSRLSAEAIASILHGKQRHTVRQM